MRNMNNVISSFPLRNTFSSQHPVPQVQRNPKISAIVSKMVSHVRSLHALKPESSHHPGREYVVEMESQMDTIIKKGTSKLPNQGRIQPSARKDEITNCPDQGYGFCKSDPRQNDPLTLVHKHVVVDMSCKDVH